MVGLIDFLMNIDATIAANEPRIELFFVGTDIITNFEFYTLTFQLLSLYRKLDTGE